MGTTAVGDGDLDFESVGGQACAIDGKDQRWTACGDRVRGEFRTDQACVIDQFRGCAVQGYGHSAPRYLGRCRPVRQIRDQ